MPSAASSGSGTPGPRRRIAILYHSAAGGTRLVAELLAELLTVDQDARATSIYDAGAVREVLDSEFLVLCYPTYFLRPSPSAREFIERLPLAAPGHAAYLVTTYELYTENSLRAGAQLLRQKGFVVTGSACVRAPGSDLTCVVPDRICPWLYRFERGFPRKLAAIAGDVRSLARDGGPERVPGPKWYTPFAQVIQRGFLDGFIEQRNRIRILAQRCSDCDACISACFRGAWQREGGLIRHHPERCELCTRCIHRCPRKAIVLSSFLRDNKRLDSRLYANLKSLAQAGRSPT